MGGLFLFFPHYLQWCPKKKKRSPVPTVPKKFLSCPTEAVGRLTLYVCPKIMGEKPFKKLMDVDGVLMIFPMKMLVLGGRALPFQRHPNEATLGDHVTSETPHAFDQNVECCHSLK